MGVALELEKARIKSLPNDAYYIPNFITKEEEERLLQKINTTSGPRWRHLSRRRLQTWPSELVANNTLLASPLPTWLSSPMITPRLDALGVFAEAPHNAPNHVLINEYRPGQGIMPHEDGAAYYPLVATVSLSSPIVLEIYDKIMLDSGARNVERPPRFRILQEPRSLLITKNEMYTGYLHGIAEREQEERLSSKTVCNWDLLGEKEHYECSSYARQTRISLTYRDVLRVAKLGNSVKFLSTS